MGKSSLDHVTMDGTYSTCICSGPSQSESEGDESVTEAKGASYDVKIRDLYKPSGF